MEKIKAADIIKRLGITKIQLNHWINMGVIEPLVDDKRRGGVRYFSKQNLVEAHICKHLNEYGLPVHKMKMALNMIEDTKSIGGKNFYDAIKAEPNLKTYFAIILPIKGIDDQGKISEPDSKIFAKRLSSLKKELKKYVPHLDALQEFDTVQWAEFAKELIGTFVTTSDNLPKILSQNPIAIVINLNAYIKTAEGI